MTIVVSLFDYTRTAGGCFIHKFILEKGSPPDNMSQPNTHTLTRQFIGLNRGLEHYF